MMYLCYCFLLLAMSSGINCDNNSITSNDLRTGNEDFGSAKPISPQNWVTLADYPEGVISKAESGTVTVAFIISERGKVAQCRVVKSSGVNYLDKVPCKLLERRARFKLVKDKKHRALSTKGRMEFYFSAD